MLASLYLALIGVVPHYSSAFLALAKEIVETFVLICEAPITLCLVPCEKGQHHTQSEDVGGIKFSLDVLSLLLRPRDC